MPTWAYAVVPPLTMIPVPSLRMSVPIIVVVPIIVIVIAAIFVIMGISTTVIIGTLSLAGSLGHRQQHR